MAFVAVLGVAHFAGPSAQAGHFAGATSATGCTLANMADNATHSFYYSAAVPQYMRDKVNEIRSESYDPTDINTVTSTDPNSGTDVVVYEQDYTDFCGQPWHNGSSGVVGHTQCVSLVTSNGRCQKHEMRFDESFTSIATAQQRKHLACHETGHSVGFKHRTSAVDSCMWPEDFTTTRTDQHDRDALNANY